MFDAGTLTFQEFMSGEPHTLAAIQRAVLEFLRGREDAVVFGAQAVNAYVSEPRMTQDIDLLSTRAGELTRELRDHLHRKFHIAVRIREVGGGLGYRLFQVQKPENRHLVDVRLVTQLPAAQRIAGVLVMAPAELVAGKVIAFHKRRGRPKSGTDWRDVAMLLLTFPQLKSERGPVWESLRTAGATPDILATWRELSGQEIRPGEEDEEFE